MAYRLIRHFTLRVLPREEIRIAFELSKVEYAADKSFSWMPAQTIHCTQIKIKAPPVTHVVRK